MQSRELWASYVEYTSSFSTSARQLAFAGAAVCWFFKTPEVTFPRLILLALLLFVGFFLADLAQYYVAAMLLNVWTRTREKDLWAKKGIIEGDFPKPAWLDAPALYFFHVKFVSLLLGFLFVGAELIKRAF